MFLIQAGPGQQLVYPWAPWGISSIHFHHSNKNISHYQTALSEHPAGLQGFFFAFNDFLMPFNSWAMSSF